MALSNRVSNSLSGRTALSIILLFCANILALEISDVGISSCDSLQFSVNNHTYSLCFSKKYFDTSEFKKLLYGQDAFYMFKSKCGNSGVHIIYRIENERYLKGIILSFNNSDVFKTFCKTNNFCMERNGDTLLSSKTKLTRINEFADLPRILQETLKARSLNYLLSVNLPDTKSNKFKNESTSNPKSGNDIDSFIKTLKSK